jgi:penicillin V acylase-like amidase (Ntn superfamily)
MSYQLIARDLSGTIQTNTALGFRLSIVQGSPTGSIAYQETFSKTTNGFGLINHPIGTGFTTQGSFSGINWSQGPYFIKTEIDFNNGIAYQDLGLSQLLSVPYAKYADVAGSGVNGGVSLDNDTTNEIQLLSIANDTLFLTKGGYVLLPSSKGTSLDNDSTNELQLLTLVGSTISLSQNGGSITIFDGNYSSLTGAPTLLSSFTNDVGYLTTEVDASVTNEIQTLSLTNDTLSLTNGGGSVYIPSGGAGTSLDNDSTNELQTISKTGSTVTLSNNGGSVTVFDGDYTNLTNTPSIPTQTSQLTNNSGFLTSEIDGDNSNELQTISKTGSTITLSDNGGSVTVFDGDYTNLTNQPAIPTLTSDLTNDSGFLSIEVDGDSSNELQTISKTGSTVTLSNNGGSVTVFDGDYTNLTNQPAIPTLTSDLTNDSGFLTSEVDGSITNEIQTLSQIGDTIKLSDGGYVLVSTSLGGVADLIDGLVDATNDSVNDNLSFGASAFDALASGANNIAIGNTASSSMTGGSRNVGIGQEALKSNTTGEDNIAIGSNSLRSNSSGYDNVGLGNGALFQNSTGYWNVALGRESLSSNTTGSANVALGRFAMISNTIGYDNVALGPESMGSNESGNFNVAMGRMALRLNKTGGQNTMVGAHSGFYMNASNLNSGFGYNALHDLRSGGDNTGIGWGSGDNFRRGSKNVFVGARSGSQDTSITNAIVIGHLAQASSDNEIVLGNTDHSKLRTNAEINAPGMVAVDSTSGGSSAIVALHSNTKGFLPPRMTYQERDAIQNPATGLVLYCLNCSSNGQLQVYNGFAWTDLLGNAAAAIPNVSLGDTAFGGVVAYIFQTGDVGYVANEQHGIVVAVQDLSSKMKWGTGFNASQQLNNLSAAIGMGKVNRDTIAHVASSGATFWAALAAMTYNGYGYTDWFLPTRGDLLAIRSQLSNSGITNFQTNNSGYLTTHYWSSSIMTNYVGALAQSMAPAGTLCGCAFHGSYYVRPVRYF